MKTRTAFSSVQRGLQMFAMGVISVTALALTGATIAAFAGLLSWVDLSLSYAGAPVEQAGMIAQITLTALIGMLALYLPSQFRILNLEMSHRNFQLRMEDVANAYWATHRADRTGIFQLRSEFDAVKERILWLRDHPDLSSLEPDVMEVAAQMSQQSADLARTYSDEQVTRAKSFLTQRVEETERLQSEIENALAAIRDVKHLAGSVELDESVLQSRANTLYDEVAELMDDLDLALPEPARERDLGFSREFPPAPMVSVGSDIRPTHAGSMTPAE